MLTNYRDRREAAAYLTARGLKISRNTLQKMATLGGGPIYRRFGNRAVYVESDLDVWAEAKLSAPRSSTSEVALCNLPTLDLPGGDPSVSPNPNHQQTSSRTGRYYRAPRRRADRAGTRENVR